MHRPRSFFECASRLLVLRHLQRLDVHGHVRAREDGLHLPLDPSANLSDLDSLNPNPEPLVPFVVPDDGTLTITTVPGGSGSSVQRTSALPSGGPTIAHRGDRRTTVGCSLFSEGEECARAEVIAVRVAGGWGGATA